MRADCPWSAMVSSLADMGRELKSHIMSIPNPNSNDQIKSNKLVEVEEQTCKKSKCVKIWNALKCENYVLVENMTIREYIRM